MRIYDAFLNQHTLKQACMVSLIKEYQAGAHSVSRLIAA